MQTSRLAVVILFCLGIWLAIEGALGLISMGSVYGMFSSYDASVYNAVLRMLPSTLQLLVGAVLIFLREPIVMKLIGPEDPVTRFPTSEEILSVLLLAMGAYYATRSLPGLIINIGVLGSEEELAPLQILQPVGHLVQLGLEVLLVTSTPRIRRFFL